MRGKDKADLTRFGNNYPRGECVAILGPKPEDQAHHMRVRRPSGGCDLHQRTEVNFLERRSREWLNAYERGLGEQYSLHASDPHMGWDDSGTKALVGSQFVLARDVEFSCAASLTFVSWNGSARGSL